MRLLEISYRSKQGNKACVINLEFAKLDKKNPHKNQQKLTHYLLQIANQFKQENKVYRFLLRNLSRANTMEFNRTF